MEKNYKNISIYIQFVQLLLNSLVGGLLQIKERSSQGPNYFLMTKESSFDSRQEKESFLFSTASRPALGPTQPPI
jgi:hypothetical protein